MLLPGHLLLPLLLALLLPSTQSLALTPDRVLETQTDTARDVDALIDWLLAEDRNLEEIPFADVVAATAGVDVLPFQAKNPHDRRIAQRIATALDRLLSNVNRPGHSVHGVGRINEVSGHLEDLLLAELNRIDGFTCTRPLTADGHSQRSGYPDLRLLDEASGRIFYLDPKLYAVDSERSTFRTFYFEPKRETNKILDDATHLIVGIAHGGRVHGKWTFLHWKLVDLHAFKVRLKAEFQASNRDLYRTEAVIATSGND